MFFRSAYNSREWASTDLGTQIDPAYEPPEVETKQVFGISLQQKRNNAKIDAKLFENIVTKNKEVSSIHHTTTEHTM